MQITSLEIPEVKVFQPRQHQDDRGFFSESYNRQTLESVGIFTDFVQDNHSFSNDRGTVRGLHFQAPPCAQAKLVRVTRGAILDVAVDIRVGSPTYGHHVSVVVSAEAWNQLYVPEGFAHGFCTLEAKTEVLYKVDEYYSPEHDKGIAWNDPALAIDWPVTTEQALLSAKDHNHPRLSEIPTYFDLELGS